MAEVMSLETFGDSLESSFIRYESSIREARDTMQAEVRNALRAFLGRDLRDDVAVETKRA